MRLNTAKLAIAAAAIAIPAAAIATPPWFVDWAHSVDFQKLAIRMFYLSNKNGPNRSQSLPRVQLAYGLTKNLELNIRGEDLLKTSAHAPVEGFGDTVLGMKFRFFQDKRDTELGIGYQYTLRTGAPGISGNANPQTPYLMASFTPRKFGFYTDLGETFPDNHSLRQSTYGGLLATYDLCKRWLLIGEVYGTTSTASGNKEDLEYAGGFYYQATKDTKWFARVGHSVEGFSDINVTLGVQLLVKGQ